MFTLFKTAGFTQKIPLNHFWLHQPKVFCSNWKKKIKFWYLEKKNVLLDMLNAGLSIHSFCFSCFKADETSIEILVWTRRAQWLERQLTKEYRLIFNFYVFSEVIFGQNVGLFWLGEGFTTSTLKLVLKYLRFCLRVYYGVRITAGFLLWSWVVFLNRIYTRTCSEKRQVKGMSLTSTKEYRLAIYLFSSLLFSQHYQERIYVASISRINLYLIEVYFWTWQHCDILFQQLFNRKSRGLYHIPPGYKKNPTKACSGELFEINFQKKRLT